MKRWLIFFSAFLFSLGFLFANSTSYSPATKISDKKETSKEVSENTSSPTLKKETSGQSLANQEGVLVTRVIDGDTIEIEGGIKVRYIGINTPETVDPRTGVECFGKQASAKNKELVEGKKVKLEKDVSETDKYGRLLRYIYLDNNFVNEYLVKEGFAYSSPYPPDIKYQEILNKAQNEAQASEKGLWGACGSGSVNSVVTPSGCSVKGNISSSGKIYHLPGQRYYNSTVVDESKGERMFCSEEEAQKAGWRRSKV